MGIVARICQYPWWWIIRELFFHDHVAYWCDFCSNRMGSDPDCCRGADNNCLCCQDAITTTETPSCSWCYRLKKYRRTISAYRHEVTCFLPVAISIRMPCRCRCRCKWRLLVIRRYEVGGWSLEFDCVSYLLCMMWGIHFRNKIELTDILSLLTYE